MKTTTNITYSACALFALACFALSPAARAVCQEGCNLSNGNTFLGDNALINNTTGGTNTAVGTNALRSNTTAGQNTAVGASALASNVYGGQNTAVGYQALFHNEGSFLFRDEGAENTATGYQALFSNRQGRYNTANGFGALAHNGGNSNTANGIQALVSNTSGGGNTANGAWALMSNTTGDVNTATGIDALQNNTTGFENTAYGFNALAGNTIGNFNIALGYDAGVEITGNKNIDIGNIAPLAAESNTIRIGNTVATLYHDGITHPAHTRTFIAGIRGRTTANANAIAVVIDSAGQLGTTSSSRRFKKEIKPMDKASEAILALKPITFH